MKALEVILFATLAVAFLKTRGTYAKTTCILIPAYDPEEFEEGENEEEEIRGWGPGSSSGQTTNTGSNQPGVPVVSHSEEDGNAVPGSAEVSAESAEKVGAKDPMRDKSKPPGPNPKYGYWEWDAESGSWEIEDYRRRRRQVASQTLNGDLQCGANTVMHIVSVTLGFSIDNQCRPPRSTCQATSTLARQVAHCEGKTGTCAVSVQQQYMQQCGRRTNYAKIEYDCIPQADVRNICQDATFATTGSLVIASPSFTGSTGAVSQAQFLSCECQVSRDSGSTGLEAPYVRAQLEEAGEVGAGVCGEDMLLVDAWDNSANRFSLQEEICGMTSRQDMTFNTAEIKLSYIPSPTKDSNGFLMKIQGTPDAKANLQVTCTTVAAEGGPSAGAGGPPPPPPQPAQSAGANAPADGIDGLPKLPAGFDIRKYPGLLNRTLAVWRERMGNQEQQQGNAAAAVGFDSAGRGSRPVPSLGHGDNMVGQDEFSVTGTSGTLSAVVASLASIILIMGSVLLLLWYRRRQQKKKGKTWSFFSRRSRSTVRSTATIYTGPAVYNDPDGPDSNIPTTIPSTKVSATNMGLSVQETKPVQVSVQKQARPLQTATPTGDPPALPKRPPRPKKSKSRRLSKEEEVTQQVTSDDVAYDNAGSCIKVVDEPIYTSLNDVHDAGVSELEESEINTDDDIEF